MKRSLRFWILTILILIIGTLVTWKFTRPPGVDAAQDTPTEIAATEHAEGATEPTMADVLTLAAKARASMVKDLDDYTARFVKQERDTNGVLGPETEILMKVQTRHRGGVEGQPMRVYLRFDNPSSVKGREVIWGEDLNNGNLQAHEGGFMGLITLSLDPTGFVAMQGQRYPIGEIGITKLVEKLLERGEVDRDNPDVSVAILDDQELDGQPAKLIRVQRAKPSGGEDDFSVAEILVDEERQLVLRYRSFGWPENEGETPPMLESYTYHDVKTNTGLTDADFETTNPAYSYP